jgi:hypothetical protein
VRRFALALAAAGALSLAVGPISEALAAHAHDGSYGGYTDQRFQGKRGRVHFHVGNNGDWIKELSMNVLYTCPIYGPYPTTLRIHRVQVHNNGLFVKGTSFKTRAPGGHQGRVQLKIAGSFLYNGTFARGQVRLLMAIVTKNGVRERCAAVANFSGNKHR